MSSSPRLMAHQRQEEWLTPKASQSWCGNVQKRARAITAVSLASWLVRVKVDALLMWYAPWLPSIIPDFFIELYSGGGRMRTFFCVVSEGVCMYYICHILPRYDPALVQKTRQTRSSDVASLGLCQWVLSTTDGS